MVILSRLRTYNKATEARSNEARRSSDMSTSRADEHIIEGRLSEDREMGREFTSENNATR